MLRAGTSDMTDASLYPSPRPTATGEDLTLPIVIYVLFLLSLPTACLSLLIGGVLAHASRGNAGPAAQSHYTFLIRTFWLSVIGIGVVTVVCSVGGALMVILIGIPIFILGVLMAVAGKIWLVIRCILGLAKAAQKEAYPRPDAVLA